MRKLPFEIVACFVLAIIAVVAMDQGVFRIFGGPMLFPTPFEIRVSWIILLLLLAEFLYLACAMTPTMIELRAALAWPFVWLGGQIWALFFLFTVRFSRDEEE